MDDRIKIVLVYNYDNINNYYNILPHFHNAKLLHSGLAYIFAENGTFNLSLYCEVINKNIYKYKKARWLVKKPLDVILLKLILISLVS